MISFRRIYFTNLLLIVLGAPVGVNAMQKNPRGQKGSVPQQVVVPEIVTQKALLEAAQVSQDETKQKDLLNAAQASQEEAALKAQLDAVQKTEEKEAAVQKEKAQAEADRKAKEEAAQKAKEKADRKAKEEKQLAATVRGMVDPLLGDIYQYTEDEKNGVIQEAVSEYEKVSKESLSRRIIRRVVRLGGRVIRLGANKDSMMDSITKKGCDAYKKKREERHNQQLKYGDRIHNKCRDIVTVVHKKEQALNKRKNPMYPYIIDMLTKEINQQELVAKIADCFVTNVINQATRMGGESASQIIDIKEIERNPEVVRVEKDPAIMYLKLTFRDGIISDGCYCVPLTEKVIKDAFKAVFDEGLKNGFGQ